MKSKHIIFSLALLGCIFSVPLQAELDQEKPFLGILISGPIPELLTKHLQLDTGQGIVITNVCIGSPGDKAGIDRDDIIIELNGKKVTDSVVFVDDLRDSGVGSEVSLKIIHLGEKKNLNIKLVKMPDNFPSDEVNWKYPHDPEMYNIWRPGRMYRLQPGEKDWIEMPFNDLPDDMQDFKLDIQKFFNERYSFYHSENGESFSVAIDGNPSDDDTIVTVISEGKDISVPIRDVEKLPKKYQKTVKKDIDEAKKSSSKDSSVIKPHERFFEKRLFKDIQPPAPHVFPKMPDINSDQMNQRFKEMQKQLEKMQENMRQMEEKMKQLAPDKPKELHEQNLQNDDHV